MAVEASPTFHMYSVRGFKHLRSNGCVSECCNIPFDMPRGRPTWLSLAKQEANRYRSFEHRGMHSSSRLVDSRISFSDLPHHVSNKCFETPRKQCLRLHKLQHAVCYAIQEGVAWLSFGKQRAN
jgi:hypothetical protein